MDMLKGRVALITGASRGIGRAVALSLAKQGCDVALNFVQAKEAAETLAAEVSAMGRRTVAVQADVTREDEVGRMVAEVEERLGPVDLLVNNAGIARVLPVAELGLKDWNETLQANLTSAFLVSQAVIPGMRVRRWGRLIFLSSVAAQTGGVIGPHYAASKAGMLGLMHSYAHLLVKEGITSNAVAPALIDTDMVRQLPQARPDLLPVGRYGTPAETADAVLLCATNAFLNGQTLHLNGGWYMS